MTDPYRPYTAAAIDAIEQAASAEHDFAGWLAGVLAAVAARKGSSDALTAGRPGSWEASLVQQILKGTVGYDDEALRWYAEDDRKRAEAAQREAGVDPGDPSTWPFGEDTPDVGESTT